jgi:2-oxo-4-hydroxy-4-carboxy-5-ureidoimidazoline decarboxylase
MNLELINAWSETLARESLQKCCGSTRWSAAMAGARPFESAASLLETAERTWWGLAPADWLEAFAAHPRIGDREALRARFAATAAWASREQAGVDGAGDDVLSELSTGNRKYEERFGYIFIVCATGKTAEEMVDLLRKRLLNDPDAEIKIAAGEQMKITKIRLERIAP